MPSTPIKPSPPIAAIKPHQVASPHGTRIDNYYWLRDDERESAEVLDYLKAENAYAEAMLAHTRPLQDKLFKEIVGRIKEDDSSVPVFSRGYWYYDRYQKGQQYPLYCRRKGTMQAPEEVMLDGNELAKPHDFFEIGAYEISPDNRLIAYTEDTVGRRQHNLRVKNLETGEQLVEDISNVEDSFAWTKDSKTVLYIEKDPETLLGSKVRRHALGSTGPDPLVYEEQDLSFYLDLDSSKSGDFLLIELRSTLTSEWLYADAADPSLAFKPVLPREEGHEYAVEQLGDDFIIMTNWQAKNFRLMRAPIATSADRSTWTDIVPHSDEVLLEDYDVFNRFLAINERSGGLLRIRILPWDGSESYLIASDEPAYTTSLGETPELDSKTLRYSYESMTTPDSDYDFNFETREKTLLKRQAVLGGFDSENYVTEFVHAPARDGEKVPVSLVYRKGVKRDGTAPLLVYGYGSYGFSVDPTFTSHRLSLLDRGFVFAIAHIRGGEEMGRAWYEQGRRLQKMNTFHDFIDVTEHLVRERYGARDKVFAAGGSAGGLLVGVVANLRPELYRGIVASVPFVDIVTTMLDESIPLTTNEFDEWGNPQEKNYYDYMLSYSPYDNLKAQDYPPMFVEAGLWDSQVQYYEPAKWVAKLRVMKTDDNPLILHTNMEAGHGGKSGRYEKYREQAREYAFILDQLGISE